MSTNPIQTQDVLPVRARVSWGAVFAGAVTALVAYFLFSALGVAIGLSINTNVEERTLGIGAAAWMIVTLLISLFLGGVIASQFSVGENKTEACVYGVLVWGVASALLLGMLVGGISMGFSAFMRLADVASVSTPEGGKVVDLGFTKVQVNQQQPQTAVPQTARRVLEHPRTAEAAWWTFFGLSLSMLACVLGSLVGSGPNLVIASFRVRTGATVTGLMAEPPARETTVAR